MIYEIQRSIEFNSREIAEIISDASAIQNSNESAYTKEQAKLSAYDAIVELIGGDEE